MKIEELISGKHDSDMIQLNGMKIRVSALKNLMKEGYDNIKPYQTEKTFSVWGSNCTACLTHQELQESA
jgi:hypothetical protein